MNIKEIQELIRFVAKSGVSEVAIEQQEFKITIKAGTGSQSPGFYPVSTGIETFQAPPPPTKPSTVVHTPTTFNKTESADTSHLVTIKSPMIGTFYRTPGPNKENFVNIGDEITPGKVVCIIEAMKLFNDIESEISGKIVKILVENASPVEYDQPLFLVEPL
jgi:acetyl-CoA carboxylase biotin carboxyl carrier protein